MSHDGSAEIAFVVPRYGPDIVGGAETLCRSLAEDLTTHGTTVDVLTTCATDHFTWQDSLQAGEYEIGGVRVRRFPVGARDQQRFLGLHTAIDRGASLPYDQQAEWMMNSVWSPGVVEASAEYRWLIALPYLFGTTFWTTMAFPERTVIIPCLHDEPHARQAVVLDMLVSARGVMLNAYGEGLLLNRLLAGHRGGVRLQTAPALVGGGFTPEPIPTPAEVGTFLEGHAAPSGYLLYAGRRERAKGVGDLYDAYRRYRAATDDPRPLALMGSGDLAPPRDIADGIIDFGFVPSEERRLAYAGALALVHPSRLESFGLVLFEAWLAGTPVVVNSDSDVLRAHCEQSAGGLWFSDPDEFVECIATLDGDASLRNSLARAGRAYTLERFGWEPVRQRFIKAIESWS